MPKSITRTYSHTARDAANLLAALIRTARTERGLTAQEVAERAGISRGLLQRIEQGGLKCELGVVFEVATIVGVPLFNLDREAMSRELAQQKDKLALLPKSVRHKANVVFDDF